MEKKIGLIWLIAIFLLLLAPTVTAFVKNDLNLSDNISQDKPITIKLEAVLSLASSVLATILFAVSFLAYRRDKRNRLLFILMAFFLFAIKGVLFAIHEIFINIPFDLESASLLFDFCFLVVLFVGIVRKE